MRGAVLAFTLAGLGLAGPKQVVLVYDGDTFLTSDSERVRLLGIDAPESYQPGGDISRDMLEKLVLGRAVRLEPDRQDKDDYGRRLRYVYVSDTMVNAELLARGYAAFRSFQDSLKHGDTLRRLEEEAARTGRGLWSFKVFAPPSLELLRLRIAAESVSAETTASGVTVVSWLEAGDHIGRLVAVEGTIVATHNSGKACHLNFHPDYRRYFSAVIFAADFAKFPARPEDYYRKRRVRITGLVKEYKGAPEIIANDPGQIEVLE